MSKKKIAEPLVLYYFDETNCGESQRALLAAVVAMNSEKFPYKVLLPSYEGQLADQLRSHGIDFDALMLPEKVWGRGFIGFFKGLRSLMRYYRKLFRYLDMYAFGVVHTDGLRAHYLSIAIKMRFNTPLVWQMWSVAPGGFHLWFFRWLASIFCDHLVSGSQLASHRIGRSVRWRSYLSTLYRGFMQTTFEKITKGMKRPPHSSAVPVIAMVSEVSPWKGHKTFFKALELVRRQKPGCRGLVMALASTNSEQYRESLEVLAKEIGVSQYCAIEKLECIERDGDIGRLLLERETMVFVDPSLHSEAFASALVEAQACGVPVVASRTGTLSELVVHESTGLLATAGDATALADAIIRLLSDLELYEKVRREASSEFLARFPVERFNRDLEKIYLKFIEPAASARFKISDAKKDAA